MRKRIAYIGLSYPLGYDYNSISTEYDFNNFPNPIIESPLGLMILYDELWFLCENICPYNMRNLPYVKFIDKMFDDLYYEGSDDIDLKINDDCLLSYGTIISRMNLPNIFVIDNHSRGFKIGNMRKTGNPTEDNLVFDIYIYMALQERCADSIELVINSRFHMNEHVKFNKDAETIEKIVIPNIPNYLNKEGPYHPCMEYLRENKYITDFRKWIIENHNKIQSSEIKEMCTNVDRTINDTKDKVFKKYLDDNNKYAFFKSTGKTIIKTCVGIKFVEFSIVDAIVGILSNGKKGLKINGDRWQGFVVDARNIASFNKL